MGLMRAAAHSDWRRARAATPPARGCSSEWQPQQKPRAGSVATHVEDGQVWIGPVTLPAGGHRILPRQLQPPQHVTAEVRVVEHLDVVRFSAALKQQGVELVARRMRRSVLLAVAGDAHERAIDRNARPCSRRSD